MLSELKTGDKVVTSGGFAGPSWRCKRRLHQLAGAAGQFADRSDPGVGGVGDYAGGRGDN